jgi:predicted phosphodiesterase
MRIAIFSDVHSNIDALEVVLEAYEDLDIDEYVCLGDVVGYGGAPQECCERVRPLVSHCILGNHDAAVCGRMDYAYYYEAARNALDHHASLVSEQNLEWLRGLPYLGSLNRVEEVTADRIKFDPERRYIVTVGSVGQPRDNDARSCFTVFDTDDGTITYHRLDYDVSKAAQRIFAMGQLVPDFGKRLFLGI